MTTSLKCVEYLRATQTERENQGCYYTSYDFKKFDFAEVFQRVHSSGIDVLEQYGFSMDDLADADGVVTIEGDDEEYTPTQEDLDEATAAEDEAEMLVDAEEAAELAADAAKAAAKAAAAKAAAEFADVAAEGDMLLELGDDADMANADELETLALLAEVPISVLKRMYSTTSDAANDDDPWSFRMPTPQEKAGQSLIGRFIEFGDGHVAAVIHFDDILHHLVFLCDDDAVYTEDLLSPGSRQWLINIAEEEGSNDTELKVSGSSSMVPESAAAR